jgi:hypothetical protein
VSAEEVPPFSDITFDDSGYAAAIRFSKPIADPASLAEIRDSVVGRGRRGIAYLETKLAGLSPGDPATPSTAADIHQILRQMDEIVESMVEQALDALDGDHVDRAQELFRRDDSVDRMHRDANRLIIEALEHHPELARRLAMDLLVARHFERIADNACKVGEKTIYALTGMRRSEYLPRHPFRPYALESPTPPDVSRKSKGPTSARSSDTKAP